MREYKTIGNIIQFKNHLENIKYTHQKQKECEKMYYLKQGKGNWHNRIDGRYEIRFTNNKKRISIIDKDKNICYKKYKEKLKLIENSKLNFDPQIRKKHTLFSWLDEWITEYKQNNVTNVWHKTIKSCIKNHIKPNFNNLQLNELDILDIEKSIKNVKSSRMRETTCNILNMALNMAYKKQLMKNDIMRHVEKYKHKREIGTAFTEEEQTKILDYAKHNSKYYKYYLFYFYTGCRPSEIFKVEYNHLNFENKTVYIDGEKTYTSKRIIPMFQPLHILKNDNYDQDYKIFSSTAKTLNKHLKEILGKLKIKGKYTLKSMRHSFATRLFEKGINDKIRSTWMGHATTNMTNNVYTHIISDTEQQQAKKFDPNFDPTN